MGKKNAKNAENSSEIWYLEGGKKRQFLLCVVREMSTKKNFNKAKYSRKPRFLNRAEVVPPPLVYRPTICQKVTV